MGFIIYTCFALAFFYMDYSVCSDIVRYFMSTDFLPELAQFLTIVLSIFAIPVLVVLLAIVSVLAHSFMSYIEKANK